MNESESLLHDCVGLNQMPSDSSQLGETFAAFSQMSQIAFTAYSYVQLHTVTLRRGSESPRFLCEGAKNDGIGLK